MGSIQLSFKDKLLYFIILFLGFQQFPIIRVGGSLKIYEVLGFILMVYNAIYSRKLTKVNRIGLYAFLFFIAIPLFDYFYSSVFLGYPVDYYMRWPKASSDLKSSYYLFPFVLLFYMAMNFTVFKELVSSTALYGSWNKIMKTAVVYGTIIALYSFFALFVYDFVHFLPDFIQYKKSTPGRSCGLSQEPGTYVLYQTWICLFLWYSKELYKRKTTWNILILINILSLLFTQSTAILGLFAAIFLSIFVFSGSFKKKGKSIFAIVFSIIFIMAAAYYFGFIDTIQYFLFKKTESFVSKGGHRALDSGATRKYLSSIGYQIFYDNPFLGVGYGRSMYYMYLYQYKVGISVFVEPLWHGSTPLSLFPVILSEMGIVGFVCFVVFYLAIMLKFWKNRNKSEYHKMFFIGGVAEFATFFSLYTPHALFLWAYLGLGLGYIRHFDREQRKKDLLIKDEEAKLLGLTSYLS